MSSYSACEDFGGMWGGEVGGRECVGVLHASGCRWMWVNMNCFYTQATEIVSRYDTMYNTVHDMYVQPDKLIVLVQTSTCTYHRRACRERGNDHFTDRWGRGNSALHSGVRNSNSKDEDLQDKLSGPSDARGEGYVHIIEKETLGYNVCKLSYMSFRFISFRFVSFAAFERSCWQAANVEKKKEPDQEVPSQKEREVSIDRQSFLNGIQVSYHSWKFFELLNRKDVADSIFTGDWKSSERKEIGGWRPACRNSE